MVATTDSDKAMRRWYQNKGYQDKRYGLLPEKTLDGLVKVWYMEGYGSTYPYWDIEAF